MFTRFSDDSKLSGTVSKIEERDAIQRHLDKFEKWDEDQQITEVIFLFIQFFFSGSLIASSFVRDKKLLLSHEV